MDELLKQIEKAIESSLPGNSDRAWLETTAGSACEVNDFAQVDKFTEPGRDLLARGGKRWRPLVMVLTCRALGGGDKAVPFSPLVELPHNGSLIIDDIEDNSVERRGKEAVHLLYGTDISINAGNLMYFQPTYLIDRADLSPERKNLLFSGYCEDLRRLHLGQGLDIYWHNNHDRVPPVEEYLQMCRFKTGSLARMAGRFGSLLAGKSREEALESAVIWEDIGVGFQIADDIINLTTGNPGKDRGDDIVEGKKSLPVILHYQKSPQTRQELSDCFSQARERGIKEGKASVERAIELVDSSGSLAEARQIGIELLESSLTRLRTLLPPCEDRDKLTGLVEGFLKKQA
ncbi:MAG: polyprenyl synthetase family protein [Spirochaetales bacterium]|nr:polyprenyl synthetase family protein [Spirochaetales bacterium]